VQQCDSPETVSGIVVVVIVIAVSTLRILDYDFDYDNDKCAKRSSALLTGCKSRSGKG
jgi:hypothetical protein